MARMSRKELKQDEVAEAAVGATQWVEQNLQTVLRIAIAAVVVVGVVVAGVLFIRRGQAATAERIADGQADYMKAAESNFVDMDSLSAALDTMENEAKVGAKGGPAIAAYYHALSLHRLGRTDEAISSLEPIAAQGAPSTLVTSAQVLLGNLYAANERPQDAIDLYQRMLDADSGGLSEVDLLVRLARLHEQQGDEATAKTMWERIRDDHSESRAAFEARNKLTALGQS